MHKPSDGGPAALDTLNSAPDTELAAARVRVRALRDRMPKAYYGGLFNGFAHIMADGEYEARNPAIYPNPLPHLGKNKQLMGALMGSEGGDDTRLREIVARVRGVHHAYGLMEGGFLKPEHADVFRYIIGTLSFKAVAAFEAEQGGPLDPGDREAVVAMFRWIGKELGLRETGDTDGLRAFVEEYDRERILAVSVSISESARGAICTLVTDTTQPDYLTPGQRLEALTPALREKAGLTA